MDRVTLTKQNLTADRRPSALQKLPIVSTSHPIYLPAQDSSTDIEAIDASYVDIRALIMGADLLPNSHHLESHIAKQVGSEAPVVHQAAQRLQEDGLISTEPRGGFWINALRPDLVRDTFREVSMLEARAAFVASLHSPSSVGMAALDDSVARMEDALFRGEATQWAKANHHFHRSLVQCSGHTGLIAAALRLSEALHRARMLALRLGPLPAEATANYGRLVEAIRHGLATQARDLHLAHWQSASRQMTGLLEHNRMHCLTA